MVGPGAGFGKDAIPERARRGFWHERLSRPAAGSFGHRALERRSEAHGCAKRAQGGARDGGAPSINTTGMKPLTKENRRHRPYANPLATIGWRMPRPHSGSRL